MPKVKLIDALTKRALAKQLMRAGCPKQEAEQVVSRLTQRERWRKLPQTVQSEIAWKVATTTEKTAP
ncbi:hypothetical protein N5D13_08000 [Stenotrophomonas maltophilia]|uniref:hypothetical protein n=1 Tax=Stenotrophomonas maltophilia TaxID=40324 RepID=UPI001F1ABA70|nr:hypothetical protein [Stenotrophomonas maltophilia]MCF3479585.1 hypothetical protein [Stenotrophomonas maltophilia]MDH0072191.1 hypothetical protein [Stenotrophomonas maltophilia]MDH0104957.1 hypothetical protein [Stenotrophomonas maltophilia]MDH0330574.1 hypothetical protein [Stenotrophomonas maltophilia]MDH0632235.1 hypothetical protein [Stenotrophomonas maltophilia]